MNRRSSRYRLFLVFTLALGLLLAACSQPTTVTPGTTIGPAGGTVTSDDGNATLVVPAGALSSDAVIAIAPATDLPVAPTGYTLIEGSAYEVEMSGGSGFATPAQLTLEFGGSLQGTSGTLAIAPSATTYSVRLLVDGNWLELESGSCDTISANTIRCGIVEVGVYAVFGLQVATPGILVQAINGTALPASRAVTVDSAADLSASLEITAGDAVVSSIDVTIDGATAFQVPLGQSIAAGAQAEVEVTIAAGGLGVRDTPYSVILSADGLAATEPVLVTVAIATGPTCDTPGDAKRWLGSVSPAWGYNKNWSPEGDPSNGESFVVCAGVTYMPVLNVSNAVVGSAYIEEGATFSVDVYRFTVQGSITALGAITGSAPVVMTSAGVYVQGAVPSVELAAGAAVTTSGDAFVSGNLLSAGSLQISAGDTVTVSGDVTLSSGSSLDNQGTLLYCGALDNQGTVSGNAPQQTTCS